MTTALEGTQVWSWPCSYMQSPTPGAWIAPQIPTGLLITHFPHVCFPLCRQSALQTEPNSAVLLSKVPQGPRFKEQAPHLGCLLGRLWIPVLPSWLHPAVLVPCIETPPPQGFGSFCPRFLRAFSPFSETILEIIILSHKSYTKCNVDFLVSDKHHNVSSVPLWLFSYWNPSHNGQRSVFLLHLLCLALGQSHRLPDCWRDPRWWNARAMSLASKDRHKTGESSHVFWHSRVLFCKQQGLCADQN